MNVSAVSDVRYSLHWELELAGAAIKMGLGKQCTGEPILVVFLNSLDSLHLHVFTNILPLASERTSVQLRTREEFKCTRGKRKPNCYGKWHDILPD